MNKHDSNLLSVDTFPHLFRRLGVPLALFAVAVAMFFPSLHYSFLNWDDPAYIIANPYLGSLNQENILTLFRVPHYFNYHPFTSISYMLDYAVFGESSFGFHLTNTILHALTGVAMYYLLCQLGAKSLVSIMCVLLFTVHPLRIESVVWISERKDVLCAFFYVLGVLFWIKAGSSTDKSRKWLILSCLMAFSALFSKAMAVSFPVVVLLYDLLFTRELVRKRVGYYALLFIVAFFFIYMNVIAQEGAINATTPFFEKLRVAIYAPWHYAQKTILPRGLSPLYPFELRPTTAMIYVLPGIIFCVFLGVLAVLNTSKNPSLTFGILSAAVLYIPVSGIMAVGPAFVADRYTYLPTLFLLAGVAPALSQKMETLQNGTRYICYGIAMGAFVVLVVTTAQVMPVWKNSRTLWNRVLTFYPSSILAKKQLADAWSTDAMLSAQSGDTNEAISKAKHALSIYPGDGKALTFLIPYTLKQDDLSTATQLLSRAIQAPNINIGSRVYAYAMKSKIVEQQGSHAEARELRDSAFMNSDDEVKTSQEALFIAWTAEQVNELKVAVQFYEKALIFEPTNYSALQNLAILYSNSNNFDMAEKLFERALSAHPDNQNARHNLEHVRALKNKQQDVPRAHK